jgi:hypothetical protein
MKFSLLFFLTLFLYTTSAGQKLKTGTYTFKYCDFEYQTNNCLGDCKVVIKGDSITIYATNELSKRVTLLKEGDIIDQGIILKHKSGKWIVGKNKSDKNAERIGIEGPGILDFNKKQYWTF